MTWLLGDRSSPQSGAGKAFPAPSYYLTVDAALSRGPLVAAEKGPQHHRQAGVGQLECWAIRMTGGRITPIIIGVVLVIGAHLDIAVPMITVDVVVVIEEEIVRGWLEPASISRFIYPVADEALDMKSDLGDIAMVHCKWQVWGSRQIIYGWIAVTESAVEGKGRN